ncbi:MAG: hypothetical protein P8010_17680 [Desulfosarcinaceae bacterium]|jgi:hypothetical protein
MAGLLFCLLIGATAHDAFAGTGSISAGDGDRGDLDHGNRDGMAESADRDLLADRLHRTISWGVLKAAESIDAFFYTPQTEIEENRTTFRVNLGLFFEAEERARLDTGSSLKLVLPGFQDKLHLVLAGDPEEDDQVLGEAIDKAPPSDVSADEETDGVSAALRYFVLDDLKRNLSLSAGARFRRGSLVGFPEVRYRRLFDVGDLGDSAFRFEQRVRWYTDDGWRESTRLDFDVLVWSDHLWRTSLEGIWEEVQGGYGYHLRLSFFQPLGERAALRYEWVNSFNVCTADQLDKIVLKISYRQSFWRPWLFFEIAPQLAYPEPNDFKATPGLLLRLEAIFGYRRKGPTGQ